MKWTMFVKKDAQGNIEDVRSGCEMYARYSVGPDWVEVAPFEFEGAIEYLGYLKGRSAINIKFQGCWPSVLHMGMSAFDDLMKSNNHRHHGRTFAGKFGFKKQGSLIGLVPL